MPGMIGTDPSFSEKAEMHTNNIILVPLMLQPLLLDAQEPFNARRPVPYDHIREADVMWARRVWKQIDLKEKINHPLYYPLEPMEDRQSLFDVIRQGLLEDASIIAYDDALSDGDEFLRPLSKMQVLQMLERTDTITTEDPDTGEMIQVMVGQGINSADIMYYKIKEDWIFEKQRSAMVVRIIGIAPVIADKGEDGELRGVRTLFWLYYPECRYLFARFEAFNRHNDAERLSFEDVFWKRQFSSQIIKWSNVYDRGISDHRMGLDGLLEAEEVRRALMEYEHDLWHH